MIYLTCLKLHEHVLYSHMPYHNDTIIKTQEDFFRKIYTSQFICKGSKRVTQCLRVRGCWRPNRNCNILTSLLWPSTLCLFRSPDAQPEAQRHSSPLDDSFLYCILSATSLDPNSIGAPSPFGLVWLSLPHLVYNSVRSPTV